jgi:hypothetical protein
MDAGLGAIRSFALAANQSEPIATPAMAVATEMRAHQRAFRAAPDQDMLASSAESSCAPSGNVVSWRGVGLNEAANLTTGVRPDAPCGTEYVSVCLPAFSPGTVHRDEEPGQSVRDGTAAACACRVGNSLSTPVPMPDGLLRPHV